MAGMFLSHLFNLEALTSYSLCGTVHNLCSKKRRAGRFFRSKKAFSQFNFLLFSSTKQYGAAREFFTPSFAYQNVINVLMTFVSVSSFPGKKMFFFNSTRRAARETAWRISSSKTYNNSNDDGREVTK
jgi:hypothetical protein